MLLGDKEMLATAEPQALLDPHGAVAKGSAHAQQCAHLQRPLAIKASDRIAPDRSGTGA